MIGWEGTELPGPCLDLWGRWCFNVEQLLPPADLNFGDNVTDTRLFVAGSGLDVCANRAGAGRRPDLGALQLRLACRLVRTGIALCEMQCGMQARPTFVGTTSALEQRSYHDVVQMVCSLSIKHMQQQRTQSSHRRAMMVAFVPCC